MRKIGAIATLVAFACIMGMGFAQYGGYGYGYGTTVATTVATTTIAQNYNTTTTVNNTGTVARIAPPLLYANTAYSANINATVGGNVSTTLIGSTIKAVIAPGTYAMLANGTMLSSYNFSIIQFHVTNVTSPSNSSMAAFGAFAFAINGEVSPSITLVNSTGSAMPVTTYYTLITSPTSPPLNVTSYAWLGGNYSVENGTMFYRGGTYSGQDTWTRISNFTEVNTQFANPIVWVQDIVPQAQPATTTAAPTTTIVATTTSQQTPVTTPNYTGAAVGIVIVIVIVVAAAAMLMRRKR
ncbi:MAG TPA: hypothetical protein VMV00_03290 [Candidatus Baltobacteraceae bacterium]|nr:hypothetical protein [Candidatus Baltobacteraceae bacterium]